MQQDEQNQQDRKSVSITLTPAVFTTILSWGPFALFSFAALYVLTRNDCALPPEIVKLVQDQWLSITLILILCWMAGWILRHFQVQERRLVDSLEDLTSRYEQLSVENTRVMAGVYAMVRGLNAGTGHDSKSNREENPDGHQP